MKRISFLLMLFGIIFSITPNKTYAALPALSNLNQTETDAVLKTLGTALAFRPVEPASAYGKYWGISVGATVDAASTSELKTAIPATSGAYVPSGDIFLGFQFPKGLGVEMGFLPSVNTNGFTFKKFGGDLKWTVTSAFAKKRSPFDFALRAMSTSTSLSYSQTVSGVNDTVSYDAHIWGANASLSKRLFIFEPYIGFGFIKQTGTLGNTGTVQLFNSAVTPNASFSESSSSSWFYTGMQIRLLVPTISAEYDSMFGIKSYAVKFALKI